MGLIFALFVDYTGKGVFFMCKIKTLVQSTKGRLYIYLDNEDIARRFLSDAENEGFSFCDGVKPTERAADCIYAVNRDLTINYVGFAGHMAFGCASQIGNEQLIKVDYRRFLTECE